MTDPYMFNKKLYPTIGDAERAREKARIDRMVQEMLNPRISQQVSPLGSKGFYSPFDGRWVNPRDVMANQRREELL